MGKLYSCPLVSHWWFWSLKWIRCSQLLHQWRTAGKETSVWQRLCWTSSHSIASASPGNVEEGLWFCVGQKSCRRSSHRLVVCFSRDNGWAEVCLSVSLAVVETWLRWRQASVKCCMTRRLRDPGGWESNAHLAGVWVSGLLEWDVMRLVSVPASPRPVVLIIGGG